MEDSEIVDLYWERSERAIAESRIKYGACCRALAYRILQSKEDSDECENDTYLRAWNAMPSARPTFLGAFLAKITRNLSLDKLERRGAAKRGGGEIPVILDELQECIPALSIADGPFSDNAILSALLDEFLTSLSKEARVFFVQRYWMSMAVVEIAEKNSVSQGKVKMSLHRSRNALRKRLEARGENYELAS